MAHSTVLVIGEDYEALLKPYDEELEVDHYWEVEAETPNAFWAVESWIKEGELPDDRPITWDEVLAKLKEKGWTGNSTYAVIDGKLQRQTTYNPLSRWDWYAVGGRWRGSLRLKDPDAESAVRAEPGLMETINGDPEVLDPRQVDRAQKKDIDIEGMRTDAVVEATRRWNQYTDIIEEHGDFVPFDTIWEKHVGADQRRPITEEEERAAQAAREEYNAQPAVIALREAHLVSGWNLAEDAFGGHTRESYLRQAWGRAVPGFATLTKDGWMERAKMHWFSESSEPGQEERYLEAANAAIDAAPDDEWFTIVDVHI